MLRSLRRFLLPPLLGVVAVGCASPDLYEVANQTSSVEGGQVDENATDVFRVLTRITGFGELCSATLISPQLMLTARHCVAPTNTSDVNCATDRFGPVISPTEIKFSNATEPDIYSRWFDASRILVSDESDETCGYDIAVVILKDAVPDDVATPATPRFSPPIARGETYRAVGYGASNADERLAEFGIRHSRSGLRVDCGPGESCDASVTAQEFVGTEGACSGDSGGPAFDREDRVIGVLSRGVQGCLSPVYVGVPAFQALLLDAAQQATELVGAPLPVWAGGAEAPAKSGDDVDPTPRAADAGSQTSRSSLSSQLPREAGCTVHASLAASSFWGHWGSWLLGAIAAWGIRRRYASS